MNEKKKGRNSRYFIGLLILFIVNCLIIAGVLFWLYGTLQAYEATTPNAALDRYFTALRAEDWQHIDKESGFVPDELNSTEDYHRYLGQLFPNPPQALTYRRVAGKAPNGGQVYGVFDGEAKLGELYLTETTSGQGDWQVAAPLAFGAGATVVAPAHATILVNDTPLAKDSAEAQPVKMFEDLPAEAGPGPALLRYTVPPSLFEPTITAEGPPGTRCDIQTTPAAGEVGAVHTVSVVLDDEAQQACAAEAEKVARVYSNFISEDVPFTTLAQYLVKDTDFYERMRTYYVGWYVDHDSFDFLDMETFNIVSCSESCFTIEIKFTYEVYRGSRTNSYPSHYRMAFTGEAGSWKLLDLQVL